MPQVEGRGEKTSWEARERRSFMASSTREEVAGRLARELKSSHTAAGILKTTDARERGIEWERKNDQAGEDLLG